MRNSTPLPIVLVDRLSDLPTSAEGLQVIRTRDYLTNPQRMGTWLRSARIINLSCDLVYLGQGYYASLLAEARGHRVLPSAATILMLKDRGRSWPGIRSIERVLLRALSRIKETPEASFSIDVYFGRTEDKRFARIGRESFDRFRTPILRILVKLDPEWGFYVRGVSARTLDDLHEGEQAPFAAALEAYTRRSWRTPRGPRPVRHTLAVLHDPKEALPPSNTKALDTLTRVGASIGVAVELIKIKDFARLLEFDALFIRMTTALNNPTWRFARKAEDEGMPVIDDPASILRCTNKVFLAETLAANRIPAPRTLILDQRSLERAADELGFPMVLKIPDGSFSRGVHKADSPAALKHIAKTLFSDSDLILAQEFMPTAFDWRVGVLDGQPLFVSQYEMAPKHWQIYNHNARGRAKTGGYATLAVDNAPAEVIDTAVRAAGLMGDALYGVDLKQNDHGIFVVEVNDNPNIDAGIEDKVLKDALYRTLLDSFVRRIETR